MSNFQPKPGSASLWRNESGNPQAPVLKGNFVAHRDIKEGEEVEIAYWSNKQPKSDKSPHFTGRTSDKWQPPQKEVPGPALDDEIPF